MSDAPYVFLSYRRSDSSDTTGRIYDRFVIAYGREHVFKDVDSIPLGVDFREHLGRMVGQCGVLIAVIGDSWLEARDAQGNRRLDNPSDFVRVEIEQALERGIRVIPVLVRGAAMPSVSELPDSLEPLAWRNGLPVRADPDFHNDMDRLIRGLQRPARPERQLEESSGPDWASSSGQDSFGLWCGLEIGEVEQRMRWIPPGEFLMGSPENETERASDEMLHRVTLTEGYWLAETACTQALWEAVTGEKPSHFEGAERPVEKVSWNDVQEFCTRLNERLPGFVARLPTEAEWEYAARAGTRTAFWWGDELTTDRANYNGASPYPAGGEQGGYRDKTVEVKSFEANRWGLYQVHGNVWEWCQDWYGLYPEDEQENRDPRGPETGVSRVLRGGSWYNDGGWLRAAYRSRHDHPGFRYDIRGFRLAAGQSDAEHRARRA